MDEDADAAGERAGDGDFVAAEHRHVEPAELAGGQGGKLGVEVGRGGEDGAGDVFRLDVVAADQEGDELARGREDFLAVVRVRPSSHRARLGRA